MKRKDKENLKNMGDAELKAQAADLKKQIFQINFKRTTPPQDRHDQHVSAAARAR